MKKMLLVFLSLILIFTLCGCKTNINNGSNAKKTFKQNVTIVKMPSPPKCKTTDNTAVINEVLSVLSEIEKTPINNEAINGGWNIMIKLNIDGKELNYTLGSVFTDSDGKQYNVTNHKEIEDKLTKIYREIDGIEVDYP